MFKIVSNVPLKEPIVREVENTNNLTNIFKNSQLTLNENEDNINKEQKILLNSFTSCKFQETNN